MRTRRRSVALGLWPAPCAGMRVHACTHPSLPLPSVFIAMGSHSCLCTGVHAVDGGCAGGTPLDPPSPSPLPFIFPAIEAAARCCSYHPRSPSFPPSSMRRRSCCRRRTHWTRPRSAPCCAPATAAYLCTGAATGAAGRAGAVARVACGRAWWRVGGRGCVRAGIGRRVVNPSTTLPPSCPCPQHHTAAFLSMSPAPHCRLLAPSMPIQQCARSAGQLKAPAPPHPPFPSPPSSAQALPSPFLRTGQTSRAMCWPRSCRAPQPHPAVPIYTLITP
jgi:hypothetical protein